MKPTDTCLTCKFFRVEEEPGFSVQARTSSKISCTQGEFGNVSPLALTQRQAATVTQAREEQFRHFKIKMLQERYDYKPKTCESYEFGHNDVVGCETCVYRQTINLENAITRLSVDLVVGCEIHDYRDLEFQRRFPEEMIHRKVRWEDCDDYREKRDGRIFTDTWNLRGNQKADIDSDIQADVTNEQPIDELELPELLEAYCATAKRAFKASGSYHYARIRAAIIKSRAITPKQAKILDRARANVHRFELKDEYLLRLAKIQNTRFQDQVDNYLADLANFGYITKLQERRLDEMERALKRP
jgi:hypothetical protein